MKRAFVLLGFVVVFLLTASVHVTYAVDCSLTFDQSNRTLRACAGGFSSPAELQSITANFLCLANSNAPTNTFSGCRVAGTFDNVSFTSDFGNSDIQTNTSGYWACTGVSGLHRAIGLMELTLKNASGQEICSKQQAYTAPSDWGTTADEDWETLAGFSDVINAANGQNPQQWSICKFTNNNASCIDCMSNKKGAWTAIGCIPTDPTAFIGKLLSFGVGIAGGIAFLLILLGGFQILTSAGNPEQLQAGRELISSAVSGLLLIIFSVFLLKLIGVDILGIPGFK